MNNLCEHEIIKYQGFEICCICGKYIREYYENIYQRSYMWGEVLNVKIYTHSTRFRKLLKRLMMKSSPPPTNVILYVKGKNPKSIIEIKNILKKSPFKQKYYEYLSFFGVYLLGYKIPKINEKDLKKAEAFFYECSEWGKKNIKKKIFIFPYQFI